MSACTKLEGTVYIELRLERRIALSRVTEGWSEEERAGLLAGEKDAYEALKQEMMDLARDAPDDAEIDFCDLRINGAAVDLGA